MINATTLPISHTFFQNAVGRLIAHPAGHYVVVEYNQGPRQLSELQAFLLHAGQLLGRWGWDKLLGPHGLMEAFTPEETEWITTYWRTKSHQHTDMLYGALLLPHEVFASLSWKGSRQAPPVAEFKA
ncbi:MAG: hypothetical protein EOO55_00810 [Hymenobacter sp.]|nr:MAG: hypothetical protein EOO55_00810 [Hymenobacter sp.]